MSIKFYIFLLLLFVSLLLTANAEPPKQLDYPLQAIIFKKIFGYVKNFKNNNEIRVVMISSNSQQIPEELIQAFENEKINIKIITSAAIHKDVLGNQVAYLYNQDEIESIRLQLKNSGILTITGQPELVENGYAAIGLTLENNKPKIIINLTILKSDGVEVSSQLLSLARIIK
jgi:hypothetical protein